MSVCSLFVSVLFVLWVFSSVFLLLFEAHAFVYAHAWNRASEPEDSELEDKDTEPLLV